MMVSQVVRVRKEALVARITCSICSNLFRDATTISECLHTFCRKCIYKKLAHEELDRCPKCNTNLGCAPLEKLRPDHNLNDVRAKIFPFKRRKVNASESMAISLPVRRKERSLSSLVVSTPRVSAQTSMTGRRTKSFARKAASRGSGFSMEQSIKEEVTMDGCPESSSSRETLSKLAHHKRQTTGNLYNKHEENDTENLDGKSDVWKPLNCLVEAANRTKPFKSHGQGSDAKVGLSHAALNGARASKGKVKKYSHRRHDDDDDGTSVGLAKMKKLSKTKRKSSSSYEAGTSAQAILRSFDFRSARCGQVWFTLEASKDQDDKPLPQISPGFIRLTNGDIPVLFVQKYLMVKLGLSSESEVEITCMGQLVDRTTKMSTLLDTWLQTKSSSGRVPVTVGTSAEKFVMKVGYRRSSQPAEVP